MSLDERLAIDIFGSFQSERNMGKLYRVLFVCMGNICRSPAAECVFREVLSQEGLKDSIECDSAGTIDFHAGSAPDSRVRQTGLERGFEIIGRARQVLKSDLEAFDLILAMDRENYDYVNSLDERGQYGEKIRLFCDFAQQSDDQEVPDPYYGGQAGFDKVFDLLEDGSEGLVTHLRDCLGIA